MNTHVPVTSFLQFIYFCFLWLFCFQYFKMSHRSVSVPVFLLHWSSQLFKHFWFPCRNIAQGQHALPSPRSAIVSTWPCLFSPSAVRAPVVILDDCLSQSVQAAVTRYHTPGGLGTTEVPFSQFCGWKSELRALADLVFGRCLGHSHLLAAPPPPPPSITGMKEVSGVPFIRLLIPVMRAAPSRPNRLPTASFLIP